MKKHLFPLIMLLSITTYAQQETKGIILQPNQAPASFVDLIIISDEKIIDQISTDEQGIFTTTLEDGNYTLQVEEAGVIIHSQPIVVHENKEIGVIILPEKDKIALKETVVVGQKKLIEKKVDRLVFNPDLAEGAKGGNALDALKLAPRIKVDEATDAISIIGKGSINVMINDRLMQMNSDQLANYLKTIRTEDIEKIEVITNPPAKYDATGNSGIINIVLKNAKQESLNGSISSSYNQQKYGGYNLSGNINYRKGKWTLTSNLYQGNGNWYNENSTRINYPNEFWNNQSKNKNQNNYLGGRIGVDYDINDKLITGFNLDIYTGDGTNKGGSTTDIIDKNTNQTNRFITTNYDGSKWNYNYVGLNYHIIKKFKTEGKKLTFDFDYSNNGNDMNEQNSSNEFLPNWNPIDGKYQGNKTFSDTKSNRFNVSLDMEHPVNSWKMNYGTRLRWAIDEADNSYYLKSSPEEEYTMNSQLNNKYKYNEDVYALYYSVEKKISEKLTGKVGLRYEHAQVKSTADNTENNYKKQFDGIYPTVYLMYQATENSSFTLNYSRRVQRPFLWFLNPARIKQNEYAYTEGNPDLNPANSNNIELEYAYKDLTVTSIYYRNENNLFEQVQLFDPETNITTSKPFNIGKTYSIGLSENLNLKPTKWWKLNATADIFYRKTTGGIPELNYSIDGLNGEFRITNNLDLNRKKTLVANYTFSHETKSVWGLDKFGAFSRHNLGLRAMVFEKKLQLSFNVNNLFENKNASYSTRSNNIESYSIGRPFRSFRFGITYNFGKQFSIERSKSNQEQSGAGKG